MQIQVIRTDEDYRAALVEIESLWGAPEATDEGNRLEALVALVDSYEARRWPLVVDPSFDPVDVLQFAVHELGHDRAELARILGSRSRASEILGRRRALTVKMIHDISEAWNIPAALLIRPYKTTKAA